MTTIQKIEFSEEVSILSKIDDMEKEFEDSLSNLSESAYNYNKYYKTFVQKTELGGKFIKEKMKEKVVRVLNDE